ncbi:MAG TPA: asparagine synthase C-terminal domain-containing protein [Methanomicrobiales archaeon]|nr:asparagine synthase C-terminal domain-containing protein [Methanomicrobiales archaeon]
MTGRRPGRVQILGWIEENGKRLTADEVSGIVAVDPGRVAGFGGEFHLAWDGCAATDRLGLLGIPGPEEPGLSRGAGAPRDFIPGAPGVITCDGEPVGTVDPDVPLLDPGEALRLAVRLRADEGVVALSGGVDSTLVAALAGLPCVTVGMEGSGDLQRGRKAAEILGLTWEGVTITEEEVEEALPVVAGAIPGVTPLDVSIATGLFFVARWAGERGHRRVLVGQGADELFGGYARYRTAADVPAMLARDFASLRGQALRDQAVARLHGTAFSLPYLDLRVVRAARSIPPDRLVSAGMGKVPLRELAARLLPPEVALAPKKAMQYGTGISRAIRELARKNGYKGSVQRYIFRLTGEQR